MKVTITILVGISLGFFSHTSSMLPGGWRWLGNFGALWLLVAFLIGRWLREPKTGALGGLIALALAGVVHYVPFRWAREGLSADAFRWPVPLWVLVGAVVGALFGALGAAHAKRLRWLSTLSVASLVAAFAAEAYVLWRTGHPRAVQVAVPLELIVACLLPIVLIETWRARLATYAGGLLLAPVMVLALSAFMGVIHRVYPGV